MFDKHAKAALAQAGMEVTDVQTVEGVPGSLELKERSNEALHAAANHFGDSGHWTRFMLPAVQNYIAYLEQFAPQPWDAETELDRTVAMTADELLLNGDTVAAETHITGLGAFTNRIEPDEPSAYVIPDVDHESVVVETPDEPSKPKGKSK